MTKQNELSNNNQKRIETFGKKLKEKVGPEERVKQEKIIPASFNEWLKFDLKYKTGVFATTCPFCSSKNVKKGIKLETTNAGLRDNRYIEYRCNDCGGYFLI